MFVWKKTFGEPMKIVGNIVGSFIKKNVFVEYWGLYNEIMWNEA